MSQGSWKTWMFSTGLFHPSSSPSSLPLNRLVCHCNICALEDHMMDVSVYNLISRFLITEKASARGFCNSWNWPLQICGRAMGWWNMMPILDLFLSFKFWSRIQPAVDPKPIFGNRIELFSYIPNLVLRPNFTYLFSFLFSQPTM